MLDKLDLRERIKEAIRPYMWHPDICETDVELAAQAAIDIVEPELRQAYEQGRACHTITTAALIRGVPR
jgi:hypothetical protein